jgi:hypothetical protein
MWRQEADLRHEAEPLAPAHEAALELNVQRCAIVNGAPKRVNVCTSCLKAGKVAKP